MADMKMNRHIVDWFYELCEKRGIKYIVFRDKTTDSMMKIMELHSPDEDMYFCYTDHIVLKIVWSSNSLDSRHKVDKYEIGNESFFSHLLSALHIYDELGLQNWMDKSSVNFIYIPCDTDFSAPVSTASLKDVMTFFQPMLNLFDGIDMKFHTPNPGLKLFYRMIGRYGIGMFFDGEKEYLDWSESMRESYASSGMTKYTHNIPYILTDEEYTDHFIRIATTTDNYKDGASDCNPS